VPQKFVRIKQQIWAQNNDIAFISIVYTLVYWKLTLHVVVTAASVFIFVHCQLGGVKLFLEERLAALVRFGPSPLRIMIRAFFGTEPLRS
jgi:hypothetical protein